MYARSSIVHGGVCALAIGNSIIEAVIENVKSIVIAIAKVLFLAIFIFHILLFVDTFAADPAAGSFFRLPKGASGFKSC
jgi:hypothetical protein